MGRIHKRILTTGHIGGDILALCGATIRQGGVRIVPPHNKGSEACHLSALPPHDKQIMVIAHLVADAGSPYVRSATEPTQSMASPRRRWSDDTMRYTLRIRSE